jgi:hypothetical protein
MGAFMLKTLLAATMAMISMPLAAAQSVAPTGLDPVMTQKAYDDVMWCIGRWEGALDGYIAIRPLVRDPTIVDKQIAAGASLEGTIAQIKSIAEDPSQQLDRASASAAHKSGRQLFDDVIPGDPTILFNALAEYGKFSEGCRDKLVTASTIASLYSQARTAIEAEMAGD